MGREPPASGAVLGGKRTGTARRTANRKYPEIAARKDVAARRQWEARFPVDVFSRNAENHFPLLAIASERYYTKFGCSERGFELFAP